MDSCPWRPPLLSPRWTSPHLPGTSAGRRPSGSSSMASTCSASRPAAGPPAWPTQTAMKSARLQPAESRLASSGCPLSSSPRSRPSDFLRAVGWQPLGLLHLCRPCRRRHSWRGGAASPPSSGPWAAPPTSAATAPPGNCRNATARGSSWRPPAWWPPPSAIPWCRRKSPRSWRSSAARRSAWTPWSTPSMAANTPSNGTSPSVARPGERSAPAPTGR